MSEAAGAAAGPVAAPSAGRLLREARERQGLHIAALAASIKVTQKKLELLEADRFDALPDATFARALALTVCRALKIDSAAVLRLLPPPAGHRLEQVGEGLNAPFRERPGALVQRDGSSFAFGWVFWLTTLILVASAVMYFLPAGWLGMVGWGSRVAAPTGASSAAASAAADVARVAVARRAAAAGRDPAAGVAGAFGGRHRRRRADRRRPRRHRVAGRRHPAAHVGAVLDRDHRRARPRLARPPGPARRGARPRRRGACFASASATPREPSSAFAVSRSSSSRRATTSPASS